MQYSGSMLATQKELRDIEADTKTTIKMLMGQEQGTADAPG